MALAPIAHAARFVSTLRPESPVGLGPRGPLATTWSRPGRSIHSSFGPSSPGRVPPRSATSVHETLAADSSLGKMEIRRVEFVGPQVGHDLGLRAVYVVLVVLAGSRCWPRS